MLKQTVLSLALAGGCAAQIPTVLEVQNTFTHTKSQTLAPSSYYDVVGTNLCNSFGAYESIYPGPGTTGTLPLSINNCSVEIDSQLTPIIYVSPSKITIRTTFTGSTLVVTNNRMSSSGFPIILAATDTDYALSVDNSQVFPLLVGTNCQGVGLNGSLPEYNPNNPGGNCYFLTANGVGNLTDNNGVIQSYLSKGYFYCLAPPAVTIDGIVQTYLQNYDGAGGFHPFCKMTGLSVQLGLELTQSWSKTQHVIGIGTQQYILYGGN